MDKYAQLASLFGPSASTGSSDLDKLFGLRPISDEELAARKEESRARIDALLSEEQGVGPSGTSKIPELSGSAKERANQLAPVYQEVSAKYGVPYDLLMAQAHQESGFNPLAVSKAGARGTAQFMPATAAQYGLQNPNDPVASAHAQAKYMKHLLNMFGGNEDLAIAAYNAGEGNVQKAGGIPNFKETQNYVANVRQLRNLYGGQGAPIQSPAGSPADQLLPSVQPEQSQIDMSQFEPIMLSTGQQAYMEKGLTLTEAAQRLKEMGVEAEPVRQFNIKSETPVYVPYDMNDEDAIHSLRKDHPDILKAAGIPTDTSAWGAYKQQLTSSLGQLGVAGGMGLEALGAEEAGKYLQEKGRAAEEASKGMFTPPTPEEASWAKRNIGIPLAQGVASLTTVAPALAMGPGAGLVGAGLISGTQEYGALEQQAREEGKAFDKTGALAPAATIGAINALADKALLPFFKIASSTAGIESAAAIKAIVAKDGEEGAKKYIGSYVGDALKQAGFAEASGASADIASHLIEKAYQDKPIMSGDTWTEIKDILAQGAPTYLTLGALGGAGEQYTKRTELERVKEQQVAEAAQAEQAKRVEERIGKREGTVEVPEGEVAEPTLRAPDASVEPLPVGATYEDLGLKGRNSQVLMRALKDYDIDNPEHGVVINQMLDQAETLTHNPEALQAIRTRLQEVQDAQQIPSPSTLDGRSGAQPVIREEGRDQIISGEGVEPSGQGIKATEVSGEKVKIPETPEVEIATPEELNAARERLRGHNIAAEIVEPTLGEKLSQNYRNIVSEGRKAGLSELYGEVINKNAALRAIEKNQPEMVGGKLNTDLMFSALNQVGNVISHGVHAGYPVLGKDRLVKIVPDASVAPVKIFQKVRDAGRYKEAIETMAALRPLDFERQASEQQAKADAYYQQAEELRATAESAKDAEDYRKIKTKANQLEAKGKAAEEKVASLRPEARTTILPEQTKTAKYVYDNDPAVKEAVDGVHGYLKHILKGLYDSEVISKEQYDDYNKNAHYFPWYEDQNFDEMMQDPYSYSKVLFSQMGSAGKNMPALKRQKFQQHKIHAEENILKHSAMMTNLMAQNPARLSALDNMETAGVAEYISPKDLHLLEKRKQTKDIVQVYRQGKAEHYRVKDPDLFIALQVAGPALDPFFKTVGKATGALRTGMLLTPRFLVGQLLREPLTATLVARSGAVTPFDAIAELGKIVAGKSKGYEELKNRGILSAPDMIADPVNFLKEVENRPGIHKVAKKVQHLYEMLDGATRAVVYNDTVKNALKRGMSQEDAENLGAARAREIINFSTQGRSQTIRRLKATTPFFSSALLGLDVLARAAFPRSLGKLSKAEAMEARRLFYSRVAFLTAFSMAHAAIMSDDEDYVKSQDRSLNVLVPNPVADEEHPLIKLAGVPFEAGFFTKVVPETLTLLNMDKITPERAGKEIKKGAEELIFSGLIPTLYLIQPMIENVANHSFHFDRPVEGKQDEPEKFRDQYASDLSKAIYKELDDMGVHIPFAESPDKLEHLAQGFGGQYWSVTKLMADSYLQSRDPSVVKPERSWMDTPFVKDFFANTARTTDAEDFYEVAGAANKLMNSLHDAENRYNEDKYNEVIKDPKSRALLESQPGMSEIQKSLAEISSNIKIVEDSKDPSFTAQKKAEAIKEYKRERNTLLGQVMEQVRKAGLVVE